MLALWCFIFGIVMPCKISSSPGEPQQYVRESQAFKIAEQAMLKSMGLKSRPQPKRGIQVPEYMMDLYNSDIEHPEWTSTRFRFGNKWTSVNTVRAFRHQDDLLKPRQAGKNILKFDLSTFPKDEAVHSAELRIFMPDVWKNANNTHVRIKLYRVKQPMWQSESTTTLISSKIVNVSRNGWESLDVRSAVDHWIRNPLDNHGVEVYFTSRSDHPLNISANGLSAKNKNMHQQRPLLVTYAHDPNNHHHVRKKRTIHMSKKGKRPQYCRRHALAVDFSDVGWNDWIVAPRGYDSFYCAGECPYPITKHLNGTNHAIVQTIMRGVNPDVPNVCCIPTTLSPINMLYMDASDKVVLKKYKEMVVEGCGCR